MTETPPAASKTAASAAAPEPVSRGDRLLVLAFWAWAVVLLLATLAQLFGWDGVLDVLDVKRWFAA